MTAGSITYRDALTGLQFDYPAATPDGQTVRLDRSEHGVMRRVHALSDDLAAVYFELRVYDEPRRPADDWDQLSEYLSATYVGLESTPLVPAKLNALPAESARFHWPAKRRVIYYVVVGERLARIIYNPESALNEQILTSVNM